MNLPWVFRSLLTVVTLAACSKGTVEIEKRVRLITPDGDMGGGRIEVYHNGQWGTICDKSWSDDAAEVVCKELGYSGALFATKKAYDGSEGSGPIHLSNVVCDGSEQSILECKNDGWGVVGECTHKDDAGVRCILTDVPELVYRGCWIDDPGNRILSDLYANHRGNIDWYNLGKYVILCGRDAIRSGKDYNLFGVQYFAECYSQEGNPDYKKMKASKKGCADGVGELSHNAVYEFGPYFNLGCWEDRPREGRTMKWLKNLRRQIDWYDMSKTVKKCYELAKEAGRTYFAVQFYGECWVSDDENFRNHGQATNCWKGTGGHWAHYVYKIRE